MTGRSKSCAERLNVVAAWWFWGTIIGVFYLGLLYILPALYDSQVTLLAHHILVYFMFAQMITNWLCVKLIKSPFIPDQYKHIHIPDQAELAAGGFEINMNTIKPNSQLKVPITSLYPNGATIPQKATSNPMYLIAVPTPEDMHETDRKIVYPYWTWKPCLICQVQRPPRTHHCPLCNTCVLKRDHHCFFSNSCIGLRNQRHFVVFNFWASLGTIYCLIHALIYLLTHFMLRNTYWDLLLPVTACRWGLGYINGLDTIMVTMLYSVTWFCVTSMGFFFEQVKIIRRGTTSFEEENNIKVTNTNTVDQNIKGVFGEHWLLNFIIPLHFVFPNRDDGVSWNNVKVG